MTDSRPETLGDFLRGERERRGLSIEQVSSATKIGSKILYALESNQYESLPALPFVRGFVKNYAKFMGVDGNQLLEEYKVYMEKQSKQRPNRDAGHSGYAFERPEGEQSKKILWGVMGGMILFGGLVVAVFKPALKHRKSGPVEKLQAQVSPSPSPSISFSLSPLVTAPTIPSLPSLPSTLPVIPSPVPSPSVTSSVLARPSVSPTPSVAASVAATVQPTPTSSATPVPSPSATPAKPDPLQSGVDYDPKEVKYKVLIKALEDVTVRYRCDDKTIMQFTLKKDRILVLRGKESVSLQASNPESITYNPNGQGYRTMASTPNRFVAGETSSLVWPLQDRDKLKENFKTQSPLPMTPSPPEATAAGSASAEE
jgi:cytoskeleton protein RodZ